VGGALLLSGVLARGVPRLGELEAEGRLGGAEAAAIRSGPVLKIAASTLAAILLLGLALGLVNGRPWALQRPFDTVRTAVPELGISLVLPQGLELSPSSPEEGLSVQVGDLRSDPGAVVVTMYSRESGGEAVPTAERAALVEVLAKTPPGARRAAGPEDATIAGAPGITVTYEYDNGIEEELAYVFLADVVVKADVLRWPVFGDAVPPGYAAQVLDSLQPLS